MDKAKASLVGEATLWDLYRRTLAATRLRERAGRRGATLAPAVVAAVAGVREAGDWLGMPDKDLAMRYAAGDVARVLPSNAPEMALGAARVLAVEQANCLLLGSREAKGESLREGAWAAAARSAVEGALPIVFVGDRAGRGPMPAPGGPRRPAARMPVIAVDREDALALYRVLYESAARAREGSGPTWVECCEARMSNGRLLPGEDALTRLQGALEARRLWARERARSLAAEVERELKALAP